MAAAGRIVCSLLLLLYLQTTTAVVSVDDWCLEHGKVYGSVRKRSTREATCIYSSNVHLMVDTLNHQYMSRCVCVRHQ